MIVHLRTSAVLACWLSRQPNQREGLVRGLHGMCKHCPAIHSQSPRSFTTETAERAERMVGGTFTANYGSHPFVAGVSPAFLRFPLLLCDLCVVSGLMSNLKKGATAYSLGQTNNSLSLVWNRSIRIILFECFSDIASYLAYKGAKSPCNSLASR